MVNSKSNEWKIINVVKRTMLKETLRNMQHGDKGRVKHEDISDLKDGVFRNVVSALNRVSPMRKNRVKNKEYEWIQDPETGDFLVSRN